MIWHVELKAAPSTAMSVKTAHAYANKANVPKAFTSSSVISLQLRNAGDICFGYDHLVKIAVFGCGRN